MKKFFFETVALYNEFIELCEKYRIKFKHYYKRQMFIVEIPDDLTSEMFLLEVGYGD